MADLIRDLSRLSAELDSDDEGKVCLFFNTGMPLFLLLILIFFKIPQYLEHEKDFI